jgi:sulfite exporter TauE/SafE
MLSSLLITAGLMGVVGGPHCLAMCGAACLGISRWPARSAWHNVLLFQCGRLVGYASLGALAAMSMDSLGWLTLQSAGFRPVWSMVHVAAVLFGLLLLWRGEQPVWLTRTAQQLWQRVASPAKREAMQQRAHGPLLLGMAWALLPCGLLYSALLVALFSGGPGQGAMVMLMFALGGGAMLTLLPLLWDQLQGPRAVSSRWSARGTRLAGLTLSATAAWGLWMGLVHDQAPWCVQPSISTSNLRFLDVGQYMAVALT